MEASYNKSNKQHTSMDELIRIDQDQNGNQVVDARLLHEFLGIKSKFADWIKNRIDKYGFVQDQDFTIYSKILEKGRPEVIYALTLDTAKELAMVEGNEKGKLARQYFIACEKKLKEVVSTKELSTLEIIRLAEKSELERLRLEAENKVLAPKAEYLDKVLKSEDDMTTTTVAKELGMSAKELNKRLCEMGVQYKHDGHYVLYAKYQDKGYATSRTHQYFHPKDGTSHTSRYLVWTERGKSFIHYLFNKDLSFSRERRELVAVS